MKLGTVVAGGVVLACAVLVLPFAVLGRMLAATHERVVDGIDPDAARERRAARRTDDGQAVPSTPIRRRLAPTPARLPRTLAIEPPLRSRPVPRRAAEPRR